MDVLVKQNSIQDVPPNSYVFLNMDGGIFSVLHNCYSHFSRFFVCNHPSNLHLCMDLSYTNGHSLMLDIDVKTDKKSNIPAVVPDPVLPDSLFLSYFQNIVIGRLKVLFAQLNHFTVILAKRDEPGSGLHVHLPEIILSYDDYVQLCSEIQSSFCYSIIDSNKSIDLDIVANMTVATSSKPNCQPYQPIRVVYIDEKHTYELPLPYNLNQSNFPMDALRRIKSTFKGRKSNENSFFRKLLLFTAPLDIIQHLNEYMMPVVAIYPPIYKLVYPTHICEFKIDDEDGLSQQQQTFLNTDRDQQVVVATFTYKQNLPHHILKHKQFQINPKVYPPQIYRYLHMNSYIISHFQTENKALQRWYNRFQDPIQLQREKEEQSNPSRDCSSSTSNLFQKVILKLKEDNFNFRRDPNPLFSVLTYERGYYFLPVFYALCNDLKKSSHDIIRHLQVFFQEDHPNNTNTKKNNHHDPKNHQHDPKKKNPSQKPTPKQKVDNVFFRHLLEKLDRIDPKIIQNISRDFTMETILYCGSNLSQRATYMEEKVQLILKEMQGSLLFVNDGDEMAAHIRRIQKRHFPFMVVTFHHSCKKPQRFMWNLMNESWQEVGHQSEIGSMIVMIWAAIQKFLKDNKSSQGIEATTDKQITNLVNTILTETNIDRKIIEVDRHKWHVRTSEGILDLLTGHVGATVPEFYMSERRLALSIGRHEMMLLRDHRPDLKNVYRQLTDKHFFQKYLKSIFDDETNTLLDTLLLCVQRDNRSTTTMTTTTTSNTLDPYSLSMYQFYVHLCKYTAFEYERLMYLLDVIGSMLVATNYARKFFILKGVTKNGKSKFFQMISRVFGGYAHTIRSVNLQAHGLNAQPELASSLFGCRVVTVEEMSGKLNENLIKEITGNSTTSFRNLYEQNSGGIPTAKILASTNTFPECIATDAFKDRVVAIPFDSLFTDEAVHMKTSKQVHEEKFILETNDSVIEDSYKGLFLMMYYHLVENIDWTDGMLHYRPEPEAFVEFKTQILFLTDIYEQFKLYVDVQIMPESVTTSNDLKSSIRYFLKQTRNTSVQETDLIMRFDAEFGHLKKTELNVGVFGMGGVGGGGFGMGRIGGCSSMSSFRVDDDMEDLKPIELCGTGVGAEDDNEEAAAATEMEETENDTKSTTSSIREEEELSPIPTHNNNSSSSRRKRSKMDRDTSSSSQSIVYYQDVIIKNHKRDSKFLK